MSGKCYEVGDNVCGFFTSQKPSRRLLTGTSNMMNNWTCLSEASRRHSKIARGLSALQNTSRTLEDTSSCIQEISWRVLGQQAQWVKSVAPNPRIRRATLYMLGWSANLVFFFIQLKCSQCFLFQISFRNYRTFLSCWERVLLLGSGWMSDIHVDPYNLQGFWERDPCRYQNPRMSESADLGPSNPQNLFGVVPLLSKKSDLRAGKATYSPTCILPTALES